MTDGEGDAEPPEPAETPEGIAKDAKPLSEIPPENQQALEGAERKTRIGLKDYYGRWVLIIMAAQLVVVNAVFLALAWFGWQWRPPEGIVQVWLVGTFVQIVGIVVGITRSLFPSGGEGE